MSGRRNGQAGFTLLELVIALAVVSVLSGGAVIGVGAVRRSAQQAACTTDADVIGTAEQASFALTGTYLDEQGLVDAGYLEAPSAHFDVTSSGLGYELVPLGDCTVPGPELAEGASTPADDVGSPQAADPQVGEPAGAPSDSAAPDSEPSGAAPDAAVPVDQAAGDAKPAEPGPTTTAPTRTGCAKGQIDINSAEKKQLRAISGVGGDEATRIVKQRPFRSLEQLAEVKGLSADQVATIIDEAVACIG